MHQIGAVREVWLFTRGPESVRIIRASTRTGMRLIIHGPLDASHDFSFDSVAACMEHQADLERRLVAQGFQLEQFVPERRSGSDRRGAPRGPDRRRSFDPPPSNDTPTS